ncbi:MAG: CRISPR-associated helicase Cas3' [Sandaracinaceae bacterium]
MTFEQFFERATGHPPFPFQSAMARCERLPDVLEAPTGAGKTATAVLVWLWRRREASPAIREATPRRLVFCLPMRSLVSQTARVARKWVGALDVEGEVRVHSLLGGAVDNDFEGDPIRDTVLVGTQDQLLSRALNRGFAMSRFKWPMHFALLNNDCLWVMDEVQLMGVGLSTTAQLAALRRRWRTYGTTHALWMSATMDTRLLGTVDHPHAGLETHSLSDEDRGHPLLARRLQASKTVSVRSDLDPGDSDYAKRLAAAVSEAHVPGTRTLVVCNRVPRARAVFQALEKAEHPTALLHSRFRPVERRQIEASVLDPTWSGVLVATQAIEAGVDITSKTLFTELAPWSSLVQRFGRCNRTGEWPADDPARLVVIDLPRPADDDAKALKAYGTAALPYTAEELDRARGLIGECADGSPAQLPKGLPETAEPTGPVIRRRDVYELFDTTVDLGGRDLDVSRYVRDRGLPDVQLAWRSWPQGESPRADAPALHRDELCSVPLADAQKLVEKARKKDRSACVRWDALEGRWLQATEPLVPGVSYLLRLEAGGYHEALGWTADPKSRPTAVTAPALAQDEDAADTLTYGSAAFITLEQHSREARSAAVELSDALPYDAPWSDLIRATHWHDRGKAHEAFQEMLLSALEEEDALRAEGPWAKSDGRPGGRRCVRSHFRHELASALAMVQAGESDLSAYLAACHHGKVRVAIRSRPTETAPPDGRPFALGVWQGDRLPETALGDGLVAPEVELSLRVMELGEGEGPSWTARSLGLLETYGPFRLALLETLIRVADWGASALHDPKGGR